ncbi:MAG: PQQ-binding-like beta-propeller repeat protein, partial [Verrucomicrobiales bacterium]|nr:PQQ-binding-like beta-propeller repeat protein [Verrucomicrobiales bacterium]
MKSILLFLIPVCLSSSAISGENWPGWRGPRGDGTVENAPKLPEQFNIEKDTAWKTGIPGVGHASPIIWENRIFVVSSDDGRETRSLFCLDRNSGDILWEEIVLEAPAEGIHRLNSRASSTPVTDGETVFVSFLDETEMFVAAYDFDGQK